jgi:hypothetical protein
MKYRVGGTVLVKLSGGRIVEAEIKAIRETVDGISRRSQRCRSGSEISEAGLYERQGARGWCRSVEGCGIRDELN